MTIAEESLEVQRELLRHAVQQTVYLEHLLRRQVQATADAAGHAFPDQAGRQAVGEAQQEAEARGGFKF